MGALRKSTAHSINLATGLDARTFTISCKVPKNKQSAMRKGEENEEMVARDPDVIAVREYEDGNGVVHLWLWAWAREGWHLR